MTTAVGARTASSSAKTDTDTTANPITLSEQICFALYSTSRIVTNSYRPMLDRLDMTYPQYVVMLALLEEDELTVGQLGERLMLDSGTLTPLLKRLEARNLVTRRRNRDDERQVNISLTDAGRRFRKSAHATAGEFACMLSGAGVDLASLHRQLEDIKDHLTVVAAGKNR